MRVIAVSRSQQVPDQIIRPYYYTSCLCDNHSKTFLKILLNGGPMSYQLWFDDHIDIPVSILELILILMEVLTYAENSVSVVEIWLLGRFRHQNLTTAEY